MKKSLSLWVTAVASALTFYLPAQIINGQFNGSTGLVGAAGIPWTRGCAYNPTVNPANNEPEIINQAGNNVLELEGFYSASPGNSNFNLESVEQYIGPLQSGRYLITFDARNHLQTQGNPGVRLGIFLKNHSGCSFLATNPEVVSATVDIPLVWNFNSYTVSMCIPPELHNQLTNIEFGLLQQDNSAVSCNGVVELDNISMVYSPYSYDLSFMWKVDCTTGKLKVKPNSALHPDLYDMFILTNAATGTQHDVIAWWNYNVDNNGWYEFPNALQQGVSYSIKRGIWADQCLDWQEWVVSNVSMPTTPLNSGFNLSVTCNSMLEPKLTVTGASQPAGMNPYHMFSLYRYFPGTTQPEQLVETFAWWQQANAANYQYATGPFTFNTTLIPGASYYVKRGVWDACNPWQETRRYDINVTLCQPTQCDMYIDHVGLYCLDGCGAGKWLSEFRISPGGSCYNAIDHVVFQTVNNYPFGPTFTDNSAPFVVPYCTGGAYNVTATIHYWNGTTSTASYYAPACSSGGSRSADEPEGDAFAPEGNLLEIYPNPVGNVLHIRTGLDYDRVKIVALSGQILRTEEDKEIDLSGMQSGYYLLQLEKGGELVAVERFVKE